MEIGNGPQLFQLKTQLLSKGRSDSILADTELMTVRIKCYAQGEKMRSMRMWRKITRSLF